MKFLEVFNRLITLIIFFILGVASALGVLYYIVNKNGKFQNEDILSLPVNIEVTNND